MFPGKEYRYAGYRGGYPIVCVGLTSVGNAVVYYKNNRNAEFIVSKGNFNRWKEETEEITKWVALTENINSVLVTHSADSKEELLSYFVNTSRIFSVEKVTFRKGNNL